MGASLYINNPSINWNTGGWDEQLFVYGDMRIVSSTDKNPELILQNYKGTGNPQLVLSGSASGLDYFLKSDETDDSKFKIMATDASNNAAVAMTISHNGQVWIGEDPAFDWSGWPEKFLVNNNMRIVTSWSPEDPELIIQNYAGLGNPQIILSSSTSGLGYRIKSDQQEPDATPGNAKFKIETTYRTNQADPLTQTNVTAITIVKNGQVWIGEDPAFDWSGWPEKFLVNNNMRIVSSTSKNPEIILASYRGQGNPQLVLSGSSSGLDYYLRQDDSDGGKFKIVATDASGSPTTAMTVLHDGKIGLSGCADPSAALVIGGTGAGCATGTFSKLNPGDASFTITSSRDIKENIQDVSSSDILSKIRDVDVYTYDFKDGYCEGEGCKDKIGLMAEDFHNVFERGSDKQLNSQEVVMALWLAVKQLDKENQQLKKEIESLKN